MGCGASKPLANPPVTKEQDRNAGLSPVAPRPQPTVSEPEKLPPLKDGNHNKDSMSTNNSTTDTQPSSSRETTPTIKNPKRASARSLDAKRRNDSGRSLQGQLINLQGPLRDYQGLAVEKVHNERFSHITRLALNIMKASCAAVIIGLDDRMVLANQEGLDNEDDFWLPDFCAWALSQENGLLTIENLEEDTRTNKLNFVQDEPNISFYAGASLHSVRGERLGILCVLDFYAKPGMSLMCQSLPNLGEMVTREIQAETQANSVENLLHRAMDTYWDGSVLVDTNVGHWKIQYANETFTNMTGINRKTVIGKDLWDFVELAGSLTADEPWELLAEKSQKHLEYEIFPVCASQGSLGSGSGMEVCQRQSRPSVRKKFKITMRPQSELIMKNYGMVPNEKDIKGVFFAIFTHLSPSSRGGVTSMTDIVEELVPFEGVVMGPIIGKGSFGSVFKATLHKSKMVAIKVIEFGDIAKVDAKGDPLEASLMLGLKHPNIVETIEHKTQQVQKEETVEHQHMLQRHGSMEDGSASTVTGGRSNIVMESWLMLEYCDLGTLSDGIEMGLFHEELQAAKLQTQERVPKMVVILMTARDIAAGLEHVHSHHILHGDLTAGNVLLASTPAGVQGARSFTAKVADFGLSRQAIASKVETNTYGTVTHMPPELLNEGIVSKAADVYAYGVLLYEVFTRKPVWEGLRHPQIIHAIAVQKKHPELPETAPVAYKELAYSCMAAEPEDRPTFTAIIDRLDEMINLKL